MHYGKVSVWECWWAVVLLLDAMCEVHYTFKQDPTNRSCVKNSYYNLFKILPQYAKASLLWKSAGLVIKKCFFVCVVLWVMDVVIDPNFQFLFMVRSLSYLQRDNSLKKTLIFPTPFFFCGLPTKTTVWRSLPKSNIFDLHKPYIKEKKAKQATFKCTLKLSESCLFYFHMTLLMFLVRLKNDFPFLEWLVAIVFFILELSTAKC